MPSPSDRSKESSTGTLKRGLTRVIRGQVNFGSATREAFRRGRAAVRSRRERAMLAELTAKPAQLRSEFQSLSSAALLDHFRNRTSPSFLPGFEEIQVTASTQRDLFPLETDELIKAAEKITKEHRWSLLGFGDKSFGRPINWLRDPLLGSDWPADYHADIPLWHNDGSDIRVLWELNRLGHFIVLGSAYAVTSDEQFAREFFDQVESWQAQNPLGLGPNWSCAMEVSLRAINLLAAFSLFRNSPELNEERLLQLLTMFEQHGAHTRRNLEFTHLATSNHYLSDVAGLLWLGIMLPELEAGQEWRDWALRELLREMDKQILPDGADYEGSTGYHRFVLELFLYSFVLCRANGIDIEERYWNKLQLMLDFLSSYLRPDGRAPLIGDSDGGQFLPLVNREANDHAYLLDVGTSLFGDGKLVSPLTKSAEEVSWILGRQAVEDRINAALPGASSSRVFHDAGTCVICQDNLYSLLNASGTRSGRPGSHQHNDKLSIEISAYGRAFIVDPGSYVYTADLDERHRFRSTAYHSTVQIDDAEQMTIAADAPFVNGGDASARILSWTQTSETEIAIAEHTGYSRLPNPVVHRRSVTFDKVKRCWLIDDDILGSGEHKIATRFHFDTGLEVTVAGNSVVARDENSGVRMVVRALDLEAGPILEAQFTSRHYGSKLPSITACWTTVASAPCVFRWAIVPLAPDQDIDQVQVPDV